MMAIMKERWVQCKFHMVWEEARKVMVRVLLFGFDCIAQWVVCNRIAAGTVYEGYWKHGRYHGTGCISNPNTGFVYRGEFKKGKQHGDGLSLYFDGSYSYSGCDQVDDWAERKIKSRKSLKRYAQLLCSYFRLFIKVLLRKRAQDEAAIRKAKKAKRSKVLHKTQSEEQVDDSGAEKKPKQGTGLTRYAQLLCSYFRLLIKVLLRKRAQDEAAIRKAKKAKRSKVLHRSQSKEFPEYDAFSDRLANIVWNRDIGRRDTGEDRGKGVCICI